VLPGAWIDLVMLLAMPPAVDAWRTKVSRIAASHSTVVFAFARETRSMTNPIYLGFSQLLAYRRA
jgi:hypothetical protein